MRPVPRYGVAHQTMSCPPPDFPPNLSVLQDVQPQRYAHQYQAFLQFPAACPTPPCRGTRECHGHALFQSPPCCPLSRGPPKRPVRNLPVSPARLQARSAIAMCLLPTASSATRTTHHRFHYTASWRNESPNHHQTKTQLDTVHRHQHGHHAASIQSPCD